MYVKVEPRVETDGSGKVKRVNLVFRDYLSDVQEIPVNVEHMDGIIDELNRVRETISALDALAEL